MWLFSELKFNFFVYLSFQFLAAILVDNERTAVW